MRRGERKPKQQEDSFLFKGAEEATENNNPESIQKEGYMSWRSYQGCDNDDGGSR